MKHREEQAKMIQNAISGRMSQSEDGSSARENSHSPLSQTLMTELEPPNNNKEGEWPRKCLSDLEESRGFRKNYSIYCLRNA